MSRNIAVGIDIGTYQVKVVVAEDATQNGDHTPRIVGTGLAESKGLRHGYIINSADITRSITQAVRQAEKTSGINIRRAFISIGGIGLQGIISTGSLIISRADMEISDLDVLKVLEAAKETIPTALSQNRKIIHQIPIQYKVDGRLVLGRPEGMKGAKLEVRALFISCLSHHFDDLVEAIEEAGVKVIGEIAAPLAGSLVTVSKTQKIAGCVLANIGAETVSIVVFENNLPVSLEVFPIGSTDITNDIALGLKIPLEEAEQIKLGGITATSYPRKKLEEIIMARLSDMFELIEAHLKKIGRNGLLPAGIIITGGGSGIGTIEDLARTSLKLPSRIASLSFGANGKVQVKDSSWSVALGLCIFGFTEDEREIGFNGSVRKTISAVIDWVKQFLP